MCIYLGLIGTKELLYFSLLLASKAVIAIVLDISNNFGNHKMKFLIGFIFLSFSVYAKPEHNLITIDLSKMTINGTKVEKLFHVKKPVNKSRLIKVR